MNRDVYVSVIIPVYNGSKYIANCIESVLRSRYMKYELIIIDDCSTDNTSQIVNNQVVTEKLIYIRNKENLGPAKSRNLGVKESKGSLAIFLDVDTVIASDFIGNIVQVFKQNKQIGALQAKIISGDSELIESAGHFITFFGFPYEIGRNEKSANWDEQMEIFGARSAAMAIRRNVFVSSGGFDEDYLIYGEETDLCWRIWKSGYKIIYFPRAIARHFQKSSLDKKTRYRVFYEGAKNNLSNIIKNSELKVLFWMVPLYFCGWIMVCIKLTFSSEWRMIPWILKGLWWNISHLRYTIQKRIVYARHDDSISIFGNMKLFETFKKGANWISHV